MSETTVAPGEELARKFRISHADEIEGTQESVLRCATMLDTYGPDCFPANELGQIHFARAMMESTADEIRKFVASLPQWHDKPKSPGAWHTAKHRGIFIASEAILQHATFEDGPYYGPIPEAPFTSGT